MIQLQRLEGFYWVARTEGYARAARMFPYPITQPGVHQQVRRLEAELGVALFERVGKDRVVLTAAGRALFDFVAPFIDGLRTLERSLQTGTHGGTLRIHAASLLLRHLLPKWLRTLHARRPDIEVALSEVRRADVELLRRGETDLLVDYLPDAPADIETLEVGRLETWLVVPARRAPRRGRPKLADHARETFVAYAADQGSRELQLQALRMSGITPPRIFSADSAETILGFVAAGVGYSLVPWLGRTGPRLPGLMAERLALPGSVFPVVAAWRKSGARNPLVDAALAEAPSART